MTETSSNKAGLISVIITPHGSRTDPAECIRALQKSPNLDPEIIVASPATPAQAQIAASCRFVHAGKKPGVAAARNRGAKEAKGDILLFLDSDVVPADNALAEIRKAFDETGCDALVGRYEKPPKGTPPFTALRDSLLLWHQTEAATGKDSIRWFWGGIGAVRRERFERAGGFNEFAGAACDLELGHDLSERGAKIIRLEEVVGAHKGFDTLWRYIAEVFRDVADATDFALRRRGSGKYAPFRDWRNRVNLPMSWFMFLTLLAGTVVKSLWWLNIASAVAALIHSFIFNRRVLKFAGKGRNFFFGPLMFYCHVTTYLLAGIAIVWGALRFVFRMIFRPRRRAAA